jgi:hypothetical protein
VKITAQHIEELKANGFVLVPNFLSAAEVAAALEGVHQCVAPNFDDYVAAGRKNTIAGARTMFPWDNTGLLQAITHPHLIEAAAQIHGVCDLRLANAYVGVKYGGDDHNPLRPDRGHNYDWHIDYANNILGPEVTDPTQFYRYPVFFIYLSDVTEETAPIRMRRPNEQGEGITCTALAGTLCIYTQFTPHTGTPFRSDTACRVAAWVQMTPAHRMYDMPYFFSGSLCGAGMSRFITEASPRQLQLLGFPPPGAPLWSAEYIAGMKKRYPGFRGELYRTGDFKVGEHER